MRRWLGQVLESVLQTAAPNEPNLLHKITPHPLHELPCSAQRKRAKAAPRRSKDATCASLARANS